MWVITNKSRLFYVTWPQIKEGGEGRGGGGGLDVTEKPLND
jgi:hypothetical protein